MNQLKLLCLFFVYFWCHEQCISYITIEIPRENPFVWAGCVFRRVDIVHRGDEQNNCSICTLNGTTDAVFQSEPKEKYRNCTTDCGKPTICTIYKYNLGNIQRPECYQCEPWEKEKIYFKFIRGYEICSEDCQKCARTVDLSTATLCAFTCKGKPTFCYPAQSWFGNEVCFQSNYTYGCKYDYIRRINKYSLHFGEDTLGECLKCIRKASKKNSHVCASDCYGRASYLVDDSLGKVVHQCNLDSYQDVFDHDIPPQIRVHIRRDNHPKAKKNESIHPSFR